MIQFYAPGIPGNEYVLPPGESGHCCRVLRHQKGDEITVVDGQGGRYIAQITNPDPRACEFELVEELDHEPERPYHLHLAVAPTKNSGRYEWMLEKAAEIGVDEITPVICRHNERRRINLARMEKILLSAMKQSLKARLPKINEVISFQEFLQLGFNGVKWLAIQDESSKPLVSLCKGREKITVIIGPEGDFTSEEVEKAISSGFEKISLGNSRLRTETAAIVACSVIHAINL